jgi:hypothetical protein
LLIDSPQGRIAVVIKYFFQPVPGTGQMSRIASQVRRTVGIVRNVAQVNVDQVLVVTNIDSAGVRAIDQQFEAMIDVGVPIRSVKWRSSQDDERISKILAGWLSTG